MRVLAALGILTFSLSGVTAAGASTAPQAPRKHAHRLPAIQHVWYIDLENEGLGQSFGDPANDPYLATHPDLDGRSAQELFRRRP